MLYDTFRGTDPASGEIIGYGTVTRDLTERDACCVKPGRRERKRKRREAPPRARTRPKGEFLAVMSHELRTPPNAIRDYAELIEMGIRGPVTEQQREDLGGIQRSQRHLLGAVNEVLNYAKLETGTVRYDASDVVVCNALAEAERLVAPQALIRSTEDASLGLA